MEKNDKPAATAKAGGKGTAEKEKAQETIITADNLAPANTAGHDASLNLADSQSSIDAADVIAEVLTPQPAADQNKINRAVAHGIKGVSVIAPHDGYRRAGRAWRRKATHVPLHELNDTQLEHLINDTRMTVVPVQADPAQDGE